MKPPAAPQSAIPASLIAQSVHNGQVRVRGRGMRADVWLDVYHRMLRMPWRVLVVAFAALFMAFNLGFAVIYALDPHGLATNGPPLAPGDIIEYFMLQAQFAPSAEIFLKDLKVSAPSLLTSAPR